MSSLLTFSGPVACTLSRDFPCNLRLQGLLGSMRTPVTVDVAATLDAIALRRLAQDGGSLKDVALEPIAGSGDWLLRSGEGEWVLHAARVFVHQDLGETFKAAIPPQRVPLGKRMFWGAVLLLMRGARSRRWLLRRYSG